MLSAFTLNEEIPHAGVLYQWVKMCRFEGLCPITFSRGIYLAQTLRWRCLRYVYITRHPSLWMITAYSKRTMRWEHLQILMTVHANDTKVRSSQTVVRLGQEFSQLLPQLSDHRRCSKLQGSQRKPTIRSSNIQFCSILPRWVVTARFSARRFCR